MIVFFFFQAEDGIRDVAVTGVQTCALPISTGPGVIVDTATASMNCRSVSQWNCCTTPPYRNGTIASPLPNTNRLAPAKYARIFHSTPTDAGPPRPVASP